MTVRLAAVLLITTVSQAYGAISDGTYSNACVYPETMDEGGIELIIHSTGAKPSALLKVCQGGCWQEPIKEIMLSGNQITFSAADQDFTREGALAKTTIHRFTGTLRKGVLIIRSDGYLPPQHLKKQNRVNVENQYKEATGDNPASWPTPIQRCR
jgi:hypothetical protein